MRKTGPLFACFLLNFSCVGFNLQVDTTKHNNKHKPEGITKLAAAYLGLLDFNGLNRFKFFNDIFMGMLAGRLFLAKREKFLIFDPKITSCREGGINLKVWI